MEKGLVRTNRKPFLIVESDSILTLMGIVDVLNKSGLNAKVYMEYEVKRYGEDKNNTDDVHDRGVKD